MGFKKILAGLVLLILFVIPIVFALDTSIQIKTQPNYAVTIRALDISGTGTLEGGGFIDQIADANGIVKVTYSSNTTNKIDISLMIKTAIGGTTVQFAGGPVQVFKNNEEHIKAGWPVEIDASVNPPILIKSGKPAGAVVEETPTNNSNTNNTNINSSDAASSSNDSLNISALFEDNKETGAETKTGITGKVIDISKSIFTSKITYFILGILVLVFIIGFVFKNKLINLHLPEFKHSPESKKSEFKVLARENPKLRDAERKLEQAKKELDEIKNRGSLLQEARKKLEADKRELERLERG
jgi:hypothetical protein